MALKFKQYRFFGEGSNKNADVSYSNNTLTFTNWPTSIKRMGIQTMPGVEFNINGSGNSEPNIIVGPSGIYEVDVEETGSTIGSLDIIESTLMHYFDSDGNNTAYLMIDVIYDDGGNS